MTNRNSVAYRAAMAAASLSDLRHESDEVAVAAGINSYCGLLDRGIRAEVRAILFDVFNCPVRYMAA